MVVNPKNREIIFAFVSFIILVYGWFSAVRIVKSAKNDLNFKIASRWKQIVFVFYYNLVVYCAPPALFFLLYVAYIKFF